MRAALFTLACAWPLAAQTLTLDEVLASVDRHYPPLLAALLEREIAAGGVEAALGKFDFRIGIRADTDQFGFYSNERLNTGFDQYLQSWGAALYGGWRMGRGEFASYDGKLQTRTDGEWRGGVKLPLFRDRRIDERRADLQKSRLERTLADLSVDQQRVAIVQMATRRYWDWVAAGRRFQVAEGLLRIGLERDAQLRESVDLGQIPPIEAVENRRAILQRRSQLVDQRRGLENAAIELSLFVRDASGTPVRVAAGRLPAMLPGTETITELALVDDITRALDRRPELRIWAAEREQARVDLQLAQNQMLPGVDLSLGFTSESGGGPVKRGPNELKASLGFELPVQRRVASGKIMMVSAKINQIRHKERMTRDKIEAEVRDAASAVRAAHERAALLREEVMVARELEDAERARFDLGEGTLFLVNLREQATADAALRELAAVNDWLRAKAVYEQATAVLLARP
ncbi:MAG: TolC family protein [Acidobacteriota bacterium]